MPTFSPSYDNKIARRYSAGSLEQKVANKMALQKELGWPPEPKRALLCLPAGMSDELGGALLRDILPGLLSLSVEFLILGKGPDSYGTLFTKLATTQKHRIAIVEASDMDERKMYAAADMALFFANPEKRSELMRSLSYGVVPIAPVCRVLEDYNPIQETGDSFLYALPENKETTQWHWFAAVVRAVETFRFPFDWRTIQRHAMEKVQA